MSRAEEGAYRGGAPEQQQRYPQGKEFYSSQMSLGNTKMLLLNVAENQKGLLHPKMFAPAKTLDFKTKFEICINKMPTFMVKKCLLFFPSWDWS